MPEHNGEGDARLAKRLQLFPPAAKDKGIAAFQPDHASSFCASRSRIWLISSCGTQW